MEITLNGVSLTTRACNLAQLIEEQQIETTGIAVALGVRVVSRASWETTPLEAGCAVTVIRATQGG